MQRHVVFIDSIGRLPYIKSTTNQSALLTPKYRGMISRFLGHNEKSNAKLRN